MRKVLSAAISNYPWYGRNMERGNYKKRLAGPGKPVKQHIACYVAFQ